MGSTKLQQELLSIELVLHLLLGLIEVMTFNASLGVVLFAPVIKCKACFFSTPRDSVSLFDAVTNTSE